MSAYSGGVMDVGKSMVGALGVVQVCLVKAVQNAAVWRGIWVRSER
ncbi:MAG TPA: hypothetical protein PK156_13075 [Polyangium sp.]|nr:hypothetical protein [Polyangium sp.]